MRSITSDAKKEVFASQSGAVFLTLLQVIHSSISTIYLVNNHVDVTYDGHTYEAYAFKFDPPKDSDGNSPGSKITFPNIDRQFLTVIRSVDTPLTIRLALIMVLPGGSASKEGGWWEFTMRDVSYNSLTISGDLEYSLDLDNNVSLSRYNNLTFPGLYS